jgi:hypothetical protein
LAHWPTRLDFGETWVVALAAARGRAFSDFCIGELLAGR